MKSEILKINSVYNIEALIHALILLVPHQPNSAPEIRSQYISIVSMTERTAPDGSIHPQGSIEVYILRFTFTCKYGSLLKHSAQLRALSKSAYVPAGRKARLLCNMHFQNLRPSHLKIER